jgi:hypothetical protein
MEQHSPDRVALFFGLLFTTIGLVSIAGLTDIADVDAGVMLGAALVVAAVLVTFVTVSALREGAVVASPTDVSASDGSTFEA